jgi:hypothetical protein
MVSICFQLHDLTTETSKFSLSLLLTLKYTVHILYRNFFLLLNLYPLFFIKLLVLRFFFIAQTCLWRKRVIKKNANVEKLC